MNAAKEAFSQYLDGAGLDSRQIYFVNQIVEYIVRNGMMKDLSVLQETPFTDMGSVVEIFTNMNVWIGIQKVIQQINDNAHIAVNGQVGGNTKDSTYIINGKTHIAVNE